MSDKQVQKAGDNSQQLQAQNVYITNGITEQRVIEICSEMAVRAIADNSLEANDIAMKRIDQFVDLLLPRIQKVESDFESFSDPSFQVLLRKAQLTAACTERDCDYSILSELLVHRINNKTNVKKKASILRAAEIIDQIDDDSLCAITMYHAIQTFIPLSGKISEGIKVLSDLYEKINPDLLPKNDMWVDNLSILGAIITIPFSAAPKYNEFISKVLDGYVCAGIKKESDNYSKAIQMLNSNQLSTAILVENELLEGYVRLELNQKNAIDDLSFAAHQIVNGQVITISKKLSDTQRECLYDIFDLYSKDTATIHSVKDNFKKLLSSYEPMSKVVNWWDSLQFNFRTTSIGRVVAHTNAKRMDNNLPDID